MTDKIPIAADVQAKVVQSFKDTAISVIWATLAAAAAQSAVTSLSSSRPLACLPHFWQRAQHSYLPGYLLWVSLRSGWRERSICIPRMQF